MATAPRATYRIQFHPGYTLYDAVGIAAYLAALGISHLYASPYLQAVPGSTHGYDVVDPGRVNKELGGAEGHRALCQALREQGLGQILDVVPNHMAITNQENTWWRDVLENGPSSAYAAYFDVDWNPPEERLSNKILVPVLGDHYGRILEAGEIRLTHEKGRFEVLYHDQRFPAAPRSLVGILNRGAELSGSQELAFLADALYGLPLPTATDLESTTRRHRDKEVIRLYLCHLLEEEPEACAAVDKAVEEVNGSPDLLDNFLEEQNFRLAYWRSAARDLGYRRFFDINTLVALQTEDRRVFTDTHQLVLKWLREEVLDGLRIDHPDGLRDPAQYFRRLREASPRAWIVAEKILHPGERLPSSWAVEGTTGYDFMNSVAGLFIHPSGEKPLTDFYESFTGEETDYATVTREKKHLVMHELLASDVNRLTELMMQICERHRRYRDYTRYEVNQALREVAACFPVYRSYVRQGMPVREEDRAVVTQAVEAARVFRPELDPDLFSFIGSLLLLERQGDLETELVMRFQQLTGPVAAKGIEDTAFYCFNRFLSLNEVGGNPARFGVSLQDFHEGMAEASARHPHAMLATSTHDTKRSEDIRARLAVLSEIPAEWAEAIGRWSHHNEPYRDENVPDPNTEYLLYQTLVGAWPIEAHRLVAFMEKATREAKTLTSWNRPDPSYEEKVRHFVEAILGDSAFRSDLEGFVAPLVGQGRLNSLAQVLIKVTAPGVPDFYQGTELWDLSLVDPDNRRPVDFVLRRRLLGELEGLSPEQILSRMDEGLPKLWVIRQALSLRRRLPGAFLAGSYRPLYAKGKQANHVVAFSRNEQVVTLVPRFSFSMDGGWGATSIELPQGQWSNRLTGEGMKAGEIGIQDLLKRFPVALLSRED